ncbi:MAG: hypothetical protein K6T75_03890 [Acetobacteraceae bacterium]|nr:hypothetical protein [Acetobacteraceae bacterium]
MAGLTLLAEPESHVHLAARHLGLDLPCLSADGLPVAPRELERLVLLTLEVVPPGTVVVRTGLFLPDWGGFPGGLTGPVLEAIGWPGILRLAEGRAAESRGLAAVRLELGAGGGYRLFTGEGRVAGTIVQPAGESGFASYDAIFRPEGCDRTYAQMTWEEYFGTVGGAALRALRVLLQQVPALGVGRSHG